MFKSKRSNLVDLYKAYSSVIKSFYKSEQAQPQPELKPNDVVAAYTWARRSGQEVEICRHFRAALAFVVSNLLAKPHTPVYFRIQFPYEINQVSYSTHKQLVLIFFLCHFFDFSMHLFNESL